MQRFAAVCGMLLGAALLAPAQQGSTLRVQIRYTGSGTVDATHKIFVALWNSADFNSAPPVEVKPLASNSGAVTFSGVKPGTVYVSTAYDPTGKWDGASGPPPTGSSLGMVSKAPPRPDPIAIVSGKPATAALSFDDKTKVP